VERLAREPRHKEAREEGEIRGLQDGIELALELKFAADGLALVPLVRAVQKLELLRSLRQAIRTADSVDQVRQLLPQS
jgi:hypothetical protein